MLCELCETDEIYDFHHFIPKTLHKNKWFKKHRTVEEMNSGMEICMQCHSTIHKLIPKEKDLGRNYSSKEKLILHPEVAKYVAWKKRRK